MDLDDSDKTMENYKNNIDEAVRSDTGSRITFEYTFPTSEDGNNESSSNKSTPYYTPLEYFQNSFEFPSPVLDKTMSYSPKSQDETTTTAVTAIEITTPMDTAIETTTKRQQLPKASSPSGFKQQLQSQSPALSRKLRRFSLYERRSCSPQHILTKNVAVDVSAGAAGYVADKENTKPKHCDKAEDANFLLNSSGNNSPKSLIEESSSPKILTLANDSGVSANASNRLLYSPKLLASISNLNLSGSPLGLINSASYKNGNYFKFPEIDQIVQSETTAAPAAADATVVGTSDKLNGVNTQCNNMDNESGVQAKVARDPQIDMKKNRKNKNNLTIKIKDVPCPAAVQGTPSPKLKTPTIKNTKEKALSLDSAPVDGEPKKVTFGTSCDEIDSNAQNSSISQLRQRRAIASEKHQYSEHAMKNMNSSTNRSTSLSHLTTINDVHTPSVYISKPGANITRTPRRRVMAGSSSNDWLLYHRKQNPYNLSVESAKRCASDTDSSEKSFFDGDVVILHEDDEVQGEETDTHSVQIPIGAAAVSAAVSSLHTTGASRNVFKHNPLLHSSSTNLKTLPEFLTLVEFNAGGAEHRSPYKQKSMELPITAQQPCASSPANLHAKQVSASNSSTNLLQRRGSNHSLTLNLHGSCGNLLGSCRSGLSVSNYSLGSVGNSTTNLNVAQCTNAPTATATMSTQNAKQSLFRRRGSNHSLTLTNLTATSCGNLNSFASQNSLHVDKSTVTRTTSFVTHTHNTATNSVTPKKGLLERRGSNQSLTLNMNSSLAVSNINIHDTADDAAVRHQKLIDPNCCAQTHHRKFFSSENLNKSNAPFGDLNQTHKRNANQVCFGSVSDLKPRDGNAQVSGGVGGVVYGKRDSTEFPESTVCTCTGVRNIMTRPLSPQATSEEFKIYLAGIQMLQNASNPLNQEELIKLNFIFDNSYATNKHMIDQPLPGVLHMHNCKDVETPPGLTYTSEDFEVVTKYEEAVADILRVVRPTEEEQKRIFRQLHKEFWDLPLNHQEKPMVFGSQTKNRYKTILPNENSRFILTKEDKCCEVDINRMLDVHNSSILDEQPYINANYIKGPDYASKCYVATQGPLPNTIFEFWLMIFQNTKHFLQEANELPLPEDIQQIAGKAQLKQYYQKIVMLTNFLENNRQKCSVYFPVELNEIFATVKQQETWHLSESVKQYFNEFLMATEDREFTLNDEQIKIECITTTLTDELANELPASGSFFVIKNVGIVKKNGFSIRKLVLLYCMQFSEICAMDGDRTIRRQKLCINRLICYHYWYPDWPDHRSPRDINALLDICLHILNLGKCESEFETYNHADDALNSHLLAQKVDAYQQDLFNAVQPLPVIHCSAGIGRTGCLTAILNAIRQLRQSLSYSLTTMTQEMRLQLVREPKIGINGDHVTDVVQELYHPHMQMQEQEQEHVIKLWNDTDSSFTRNTLIYIQHIVKGQQVQQLQQQQDQDQDNGLVMNVIVSEDDRDEDDGEGEDGGGVENEGEEQVVVDCNAVKKITLSLKQLPKLPDIFVDCLGIVCNLRLQRGGMVQNSEQYELIHRAICLYMKRTFALKRF